MGNKILAVLISAILLSSCMQQYAEVKTSSKQEFTREDMKDLDDASFALYSDEIFMRKVHEHCESEFPDLVEASMNSRDHYNEIDLFLYDKAKIFLRRIYYKYDDGKYDGITYLGMKANAIANADRTIEKYFFRHNSEKRHSFCQTHFQNIVEENNGLDQRIPTELQEFKDILNKHFHELLAEDGVTL